MSILQEVLKWAMSLPAWQSDAVSRLLAKTDLTEQDLDDLCALLKAAHGIVDPDGRTPRPLKATQIPVPAQANRKVVLRGIKNLRNVNAIAANHRLPISPTGLTVIYGDNGVGKSGYSRVLKRACRARDQEDPILPNANLPPAKTAVAEAEFEVTADGAERDLRWVDGGPAPEELSTLAIFDARCARAYLDDEDDFSYIPYGLDVFERLARVCQRLKSKLEQEKNSHNVDLSAFALLQGDTAVGRLINSLSAKTSPSSVDTLCRLTSDEESRHGELARSLKENNPKEKARQLRLQARRFTAVAASMRRALETVDADKADALRVLVENARVSQEAVEVAARKLHEEAHLLPGTGGAAWKHLFEAARQFALESDPTIPIHELGPGSPCPLCQQPLQEGADRLRRFSEFVCQHAAKTAVACQAALEATLREFDESEPNVVDEIICKEIEAIDPGLAADILRFQNEVVARYQTIKLAARSADWSVLSAVSADPCPHVDELSRNLASEAATLENLLDSNAREALQREFNELDGRIRLRTVKDAVLGAVAKLNHQSKLTKCVGAVKTHAISLKAAELTEQVVSKGLESALNKEFRALGVGSLRVSLQSRSDKGKSLHKLRLELPQRRSPGDILSEGEQRAIAIGSFLAEVGLGEGTDGIIFDDPVSSLDHVRRELVARRLVAEAGRRQVIVLTHDIYFLCVIQEEADVLGIAVMTQSLTRNPDGFGVASNELPFEGRDTKQRIGALKAQHQTIAKLHKTGHEQECRRATLHAYAELRMAWERAVEEVLFRKVILRFRKGIETRRLTEVAVEESDVNQIEAGMAKCSNYVHDKAHVGGVAIPAPDELLDDIQKLERWKEQVDGRSKAIAAGRKRVA